MKVSFSQNIDNKPKVRLRLMKNRAVKVADLTDEQVAQTNLTKQLPKGYHLVYSLNGYGTRNPSCTYQMTITKGLPKLHPLTEPFYFDTLQNGYELENYKGKTYLRETGTTVKEIKSKTNYALAAFSILTALILGIIYKKSPKK